MPAGGGQCAYPFILWDGHRFARTAAEHERDIRYIKDLGFTHTLVTGWFDPARAVKDAQRVGPLLELCEKYDIHAGLRFPWEFKHLDIPWEQMVARGMTLRARPTGKHDDFNPVHPEIVRYCRDGLVLRDRDLPPARSPRQDRLVPAGLGADLAVPQTIRRSRPPPSR